MASTPKKPTGFEETPQQPLTGKPLSGDISAWADEISKGEDDTTHRDNRRGGADAPRPRRPGKAGIAAAKKAEKKATPAERAAGGLMPIAGLDVSVEEAEALLAKSKKTRKAKPGNDTIAVPFGYEGEKLTGITATVDALSKLISEGDPLIKNGEKWTPHRPERPEKDEGGIALKLVSPFEPKGDQPTAIRDLLEGLGEYELAKKFKPDFAEASDSELAAAPPLCPCRGISPSSGEIGTNSTTSTDRRSRGKGRGGADAPRPRRLATKWRNSREREPTA